MSLVKADVLIGRPGTLTVTGASLSYTCIQGDKYDFREEPNVVRTPLADGLELPIIQSRKSIFEITIEVLDQTDLDAINDSGTGITFATTTGGDNGTGHTLTIASPDLIMAHVDGGKTHITVEVSACESDAPGWALASNA